jgi:hypothetical protein
MKGLGHAMRCINKMRMRCAKISGEFVESVVADKLAWWHVEHAVFGVQFLDGRTTTRCITFAEDLLKVALKQLMDTVFHNIFRKLLTEGRCRSNGADECIWVEVSGATAIQAYAAAAEGNHM